MAFFHYSDDCEEELDKNQSNKVDSFLPKWGWLKIKKKKTEQADEPNTYSGWDFEEVNEKSMDSKQLYAIYVSIVDALSKIFDNQSDIFTWAITPLPDFDGRTPTELCQSGKSQIVLDYLEDRLLGHPG